MHVEHDILWGFVAGCAVSVLGCMDLTIFGVFSVYGHLTVCAGVVMMIMHE